MSLSMDFRLFHMMMWCTGGKLYVHNCQRFLLFTTLLELNDPGSNNPLGAVIESKKERHVGFARGHPPYYWPRLNTLDFLDRTG